MLLNWYYRITTTLDFIRRESQETAMLTLSRPFARVSIAAVVLCLFSVLAPSTVVAQGCDASGDVGVWLEVDRLDRPREGASLVDLGDGSVLLVGGGDSGGALASSRRFDQRTGVFTAGPELNVARSSATAVTLHEGRVWVVGGQSGDPIRPVASTELYDPATGDVVLGGSLGTARFGHTATLLLDGRVLVAGGWVPDGPCDASAETCPTMATDTAELFDPQAAPETGPSPLLDMAVPRRDHTATRLADGRVLVVGGAAGGLARHDSVQIFNPATGGWTSAAPLLKGRSGHRAVALDDGRVLVIGGLTFMAGDPEPLAAADSEIYDPTDNAWSPGPNLAQARWDFVARRLADGRVWVAGGRGDDACPEPTSTELYDPASGTFVAAAALPEPRTGAASILLPGGRPLLVGGRNLDQQQLASAYLFVPNGGGFVSGDSLGQGRKSTTAALLPTGEVLTVAGRGPGGEALGSAELYNPDADAFRATGGVSAARTAATLTVLHDGRAALVGGKSASDSPLASVDLYDPDTGMFDEHSDVLQHARWDHSTTVLPDGSLLVCGGHLGSGNGYGDSCERVNLGDAGPSSTVVAQRPGRPWFRHAATPLADGRVMLTGGVTPDDNTTLFDAGIYDPFTDTLISVTPMHLRRRRHTATGLSDGRVLVTGGNSGSHSAEIYDPSTDDWAPLPDMAQAFESHTALALADGSVVIFGGRTLAPWVQRFETAAGAFVDAGLMMVPRHDGASAPLPDGRLLTLGGNQDGVDSIDSSELFSHVLPSAVPGAGPGSVVDLPRLDPVAGVLDPLQPWTLTGDHLHSAVESHGGGSRMAGERLTLTLRSLSDGRVRFLTVRSLDPSTLPSSATVTVAPPALAADAPPPGFHLLTPIVGGRMGSGIVVELGCGFALGNPADQVVELRQTATFEVTAPGARAFQWQRSEDGGFNWTDLEGARSATYETEPALGEDHGTLFRVRADAGCASAVSAPAELRMTDAEPPEVSVTRPTAGEVWLLSSPDAEPHVQAVTWSAVDDLPLAELLPTLEWTHADGSPGEQPLCFDGGCVNPDPADRSLLFRVPTAPPGGVGARYRVRLRAVDVAGNETEAVGEPFLMVAEDFTRKTLLLTHRARLVDRFPSSITNGELDRLLDSLGLLAAHPRVQGVVVDLEQVPGLDSALFEAWDDDPADPIRANRVLFGDGGVQDVILALADAYPALEHLVIVGDDHILPFARLADGTPFLAESDYLDPARGEPGSLLDPVAASGIVGALAANRYLSDDPLAVLERITVDDVDDVGLVALPDLAVGRLVESPAAMAQVMERFIDRDGILELDDTVGEPGRGATVAGYDFLRDVARRVADRWQSAAIGPVDDDLADGQWGQPPTDAARDALHGRLAAGGGAFGLFGHAAHNAFGVPGLDRFDLQGLDALDLTGADACGRVGSRPPIEFGGALVYAVGCHGALSVPGSCSDGASFDLPEVVLQSGALAYLANTGYGWGLLHGIGYGERLVELFTDQPSAGPISVGQAVRRAKISYLLEDSRLDPFDLKTLQQWTLFGLPMTELRTPAGPVDDGGIDGVVSGDGRFPESGRVEVAQRTESADEPGSDLPPGLTVVRSDFDFSAEGVYRLYGADGDEMSLDDDCLSEHGCYLTLNGLTSGEADRPLEPYFRYDAALSGTRPQGVLWLGGRTVTTAPWRPILGRPASNEDVDTEIDPGALPRILVVGPIPTYVGDGCQVGSVGVLGGLGQNAGRLLISAGVTLFDTPPIAGEPLPTAAHRRFLDYQVETFYRQDGGCGTGPIFDPGPFDGRYHQRDAAGLRFAVSASDSEGVWRVVVVWTTDAENPEGYFYPLELEADADGVFRGQIPDSELSGDTLTYVLQAVDLHGAVRVLNIEEHAAGEDAGEDVGEVVGGGNAAADTGPSSGIDRRLPLTVDVDLDAEGVGPSLREVRTVPGGRSLESGDELDLALARVDLELSVPADPSADVRLVALTAGEDPRCVDDPEPWPTLVLGGPTAETVSLHLGTDPPPPGLYRLLVCDLRDALGRAVPETALDFRLTADHLLQNGGFDQGLDGWLAEGFARFIEADASDVAGSYSLLLPVSPSGTPAAGQCAPLQDPPASKPFVMAAKARTAHCAGGAVEVRLDLEAFPNEDCQGPATVVRELRGLFVDPPAGPGLHPHDPWIELRGHFTPPSDTAGLRLHISAVADRSCSVWIDETRLHVEPGGLFFGGFESGSTQGWSGTF